ncbi:MAG: ABC transporter substrate-binding protein [Chloroflexia bacterium]
MGRERLPFDAAAAMPRIGRRQLVRRAGLAAVSLAALPLLAACRSNNAPTVAPTSTVSTTTPTAPAPTLVPTPTPVLHSGASLRLWALSSLAPAADRALQALAAEWAREQGAEVAVEFVGVSELKARLATPGVSGADIVQCRDNWAWLWPDQFADLASEAEKLSTAGGGFLDAPAMHGRVNGTWKAIPFSVAPTAVIYRADQYRDAGATTFPATLNDLLAVGGKLKVAGHPFGAPAGRSSEDPRALWSAILWSFGGRMVEADGKTIAIGAAETRAALDWAAQFWTIACAADGLNWDDNANNRLYTNGQIAATLNNPAIYLYAKGALPDLAAQSNHAVFPAGPSGQGGPVTHLCPRDPQVVAAAGGGARFPALARPSGADRALFRRRGRRARPRVERRCR